MSAPAFASDCSGRLLMLGACPSERGLAGTTPDQLKQSLIGAGQVWAFALSGPLLDGIGGLLSRLLTPRITAYASQEGLLTSVYRVSPVARGTSELDNGLDPANFPRTDELDGAAHFGNKARVVDFATSHSGSHGVGFRVDVAT